jgi:hypothetical protein
MSNDHDVLYLQHVDGELQHREVISVLRWSEVGDISMYEELARVEVYNFVGRHAAIGAADP